MSVQPEPFTYDGGRVDAGGRRGLRGTHVGTRSRPMLGPPWDRGEDLLGTPTQPPSRRLRVFPDTSDAPGLVIY